MFATSAVCTRCGAIHALGDQYLYTCERCGGILDLQYDYQEVAAHDSLRVLLGPGRPQLWKYAPLLPIGDASAAVSLGEGGTQLVRCQRLGEVLGLESLYVKDESTNPTGSFKDRPLSVAVTKARELGADTVITASSGNAGAAMAAYAARGGLRSIVFMPAGTPVAKTTQMLICGARAVFVRGSYSDAFKLAQRATTRFGWINVSTTYLSPYPTEGDKTVAYELCEQLDWRAPHWVLVPVGAGPLLAGTCKGFREYHKLGLIASLPAMVAVQAEGCAPIAEAYAQGRQEVLPWPRPDTVAGGIRDALTSYAQDGTYTLRVVRESGGAAIAVSDREILEAVRLLATKEGIFAEPSAAATIAGLQRLVQSGHIRPSDTVVCVLTGHGLKDVAAVRPLLKEEPPVFDPDAEDLDHLLDAI